jgi:hypothetical protein
MCNRSQSIELRFSDIQTSLSRSSFVKALCSLYARSSQLFKHILAQTKNKGADNKKDKNLSRSQERNTQITNKVNKPRIKKGGAVPRSTQRKPG